MRSLADIRTVTLGIFGGLLLSFSALADLVVTKGSKAAELDSCVAPTTVMRRDHMDFLKHGRDETVHKGIRETEFSLSECVDCHAEKEAAGGYKPVNAQGQFCASCHSYVAVSLNCFQCHRKTPEPAQKVKATISSDQSPHVQEVSKTAESSMPLSTPPEQESLAAESNTSPSPEQERVMVESDTLPLSAAEQESLMNKPNTPSHTREQDSKSAISNTSSSNALRLVSGLRVSGQRAVKNKVQGDADHD